MKKDERYFKEFEGSKEDLKIYYESTSFEPIEDRFGSLDDLMVGEQMDDITCSKIIKRKADDLFVMFSLTRESFIEEFNIKPLPKISHL